MHDMGAIGLGVVLGHVALIPLAPPEGTMAMAINEVKLLECTYVRVRMCAYLDVSIKTEVSLSTKMYHCSNFNILQEDIRDIEIIQKAQNGTTKNANKTSSFKTSMIAVPRKLLRSESSWIVSRFF